MFKLCFLLRHRDLKIANYVKRAVIAFACSESKLVITDNFGISMFSCNEIQLEKCCNTSRKLTLLVHSGWLRNKWN